MPKGTLQRIIDVINTLKEKGIYRSTLLTELEGAENYEKPKLQDILTIYDAYENLLGDQFVDGSGLFKHINEDWDPLQSPSLVKSHFREVTTIFVSGFDEFSDPELTVLFHLSNIQGIGMLVSFDYHLENDEVFGHLKENYQKFKQMGFQKITTPSSSGKTFSQHITEHLFKYDVDIPKFSCRESVTVFAADDRTTEVEMIAKIIKRLVIDNPNRDLSKICVSMYQPQMYTNLFREVFEQYGIPANITDRYYLDQSPIVVSIISLLAVKQHNFRLHDIMRALSSQYLQITNSPEMINAANLYQVAALLKISVGYNTWLSKIEQHLMKIREGLFDVEDGLEGEQLGIQEQMLKKACTDLMILSNLLQPFEGRLTPKQFKKKLLSLLDELQIVDCILKGRVVLADDEKLEKDTRVYQKFLVFLDEFLEILALEGKEDIQESLSFYVDRLREAISQVRYNIRERYGYGVSVTSFDETRGLRFDVMIIAGLVDGEFPPAYQPEIFFSSARRAQKERYHLHEHRYLFYQALTNFTERLYIMFPQSDSEIKLVPSSFIDALIKIAEVEDHRESIPSELSEPIYSKDELFYRLGQITGSTEDLPEHETKLEIPDLQDEITEVLESMRRAIRVESHRLRGIPIPEYNGKIGGQLGVEAQNVFQRFRERVYSVTQLESYGRCPFQFFADKVLRLNIIEEVEEGISPIERGGILHEILFEFYVNRRNKKLSPLSQIDERQFQEAIDDLITLANRKLNELNISEIFWDIDKETILGSPNRKGVLREFLELERQNTLEVHPKFFEVAFGSGVGTRKNADPNLSSHEPVTAGKVRLRGKVDRIDIGEDTFRIVDYKTGTKIPKREEIENGMSLQLPIYLYAVEHILAKHLGGDVRGVAGIYYTLTSPVKENLGIGSAVHRDKAFKVSRKSKQLLDSDEELHGIIDVAIRYVNEYVDSISNGVFPVEPKDSEKVCAYCDFITICRFQNRVRVQSDAGLNNQEDNK